LQAQNAAAPRLLYHRTAGKKCQWVTRGFHDNDQSGISFKIPATTLFFISLELFKN
jgi:hypothetical protein